MIKILGILLLVSSTITFALDKSLEEYYQIKYSEKEFSHFEIRQKVEDALLDENDYMSMSKEVTALTCTVSFESLYKKMKGDKGKILGFLRKHPSGFQLISEVKFNRKKWKKEEVHGFETLHYAMFVNQNAKRVAIINRRKKSKKEFRVKSSVNLHYSSHINAFATPDEEDVFLLGTNKNRAAHSVLYPINEKTAKEGLNKWAIYKIKSKNNKLKLPEISRSLLMYNKDASLDLLCEYASYR